ncbi:MAG: YjdF family protein [Clostridium sp.]
MINAVKLTILFSNPFWIGVFERYEGSQYKACKVTFGAEPKEAEVYDFVLRNYYSLKFKMLELQDDENEKSLHVKKENPKRVQRMIHKEVQNKGIGTKAQIALKAQHEENKIEHRKRSREEKELEEQRQYEIKRQKRKEKHKGH